MSKKEESLRRSALSRVVQDRDRAARHRVAAVLATANVLAMGALPFMPRRVNFEAERGRFSSGDHHPNKCSCKQCSDWRRAERYR